MSGDRFKGKIQTIKGHIKEAWGRMFNDEAKLCDGRKDKFFGRYREKYGVTKEEAKERLRKFEEESLTASCNRL